MDKTDIKSMNMAELAEYVQALGQPAYRAKQLYEWMHVRLAVSYESMTNLPALFKRVLGENTVYTVLQTEKVQVSAEDSTAKYLFRLADGNLIESVLMHYRHGDSVCISSQAGCRMGCAFCASTLDGLARNLTPAEMLDQVYRIQEQNRARVSNVVIMGTGEPFDNFDSFIKFLQMLTDKNGLNISARNITVSTCGIVPKIYELADMNPQLTLAISLHAPTDGLRQSLMPIARKYSVSEIIEACRYFTGKTGRRVTFEYSLISGINDTRECAGQLAQLLRGMNCHVNLIPVNPVKERGFKQPKHADVDGFAKALRAKKINVTVRRRMGRDIDGACGQLRKRYSNSPKEARDDGI